MIGNLYTKGAVASSNFMDPMGDVTAQWTPSTVGTHWNLVDDAIRQPTAGEISDYVTTTVDAKIDEYTMTDPNRAATNLVVWAYITGSSAGNRIKLDVRINGSLLGVSGTLGASGANMWVSKSYAGNWTAADLATAQVKVISYIPDYSSITVYEVYAILS